MNGLTIDNSVSSKSLPVQHDSKSRGSGFGERLKQAVEEVNRLQRTADSSMEQVVEGKLGIHEGMIAVTEADLSLRLMLQIRNKVMDAYREIIRMQF